MGSIGAKSRRSAAASHRLDPLGQSGDRGRLEERAKRDLHAECLAESRDDLRRQQEWPPRSKKLSWAPTRSTPKSDPQTDATISSIGPRGGTKSATCRKPGLARVRKGLPIDLAVGRQRQRVEHTNAEGIM